MIKLRSDRRKAYKLDAVTRDTPQTVACEDLVEQQHVRIAVSDWNRLNHLTGDDRLHTEQQWDRSILIYTKAAPPRMETPTKEQFFDFLRVMANGQHFALGPPYRERYGEFKAYCREFSEADQCSIVAIDDDPQKLIILRYA